MSLSLSDLAALSALFDAAMELDPTECRAWIDSLPADQRHLREPLSAMLEGAAHTAAMLPALTGAGPAGDADDAHVDERVGPYRLLRPIGRGGMGSVWLAERADGSFQRQVALKLPRLAWVKGLKARMARERRIGALLEHPHIARLYDAGVDDKGRPYIAMEAIAGQPIDVWCRERKIGVRERLALFTQTIRAVAHAHGRLVIHRDLKPANVLVDAAGQVHLLDFGIAKLLAEASQDDDKLTQEQGSVLTPEYAAPEQIAGQPVGVQADIYALGVLLYELLTGQLPHALKRKTLGALEDAVLQGDAPLASRRVQDKSMRRLLRGDVDAILAKALKREPADRYATADAFADDVERHLAGDTVSAQPDSAWYRARKAVLRHRLGFAMAALLVVVVAVGATTTVIQARRASQEADRARRVTDFVTELFRVRADAPTSAQEDFLEHGIRQIQGRFPDEPDMQARLYGALGQVYADLGAVQLSARFADQQIEALNRMNADALTRARAELNAADMLIREGQVHSARQRAERAVDLARGDRLLFGLAHAMLARAAIDVDQTEKAEQSIAIAKPILTADGIAPSIGAAWVYEAEEMVLMRANRFGETDALFARALDGAIRAEGPDSKLATDLMSRRVVRLLNRNRNEEADQLIHQVIARLRKSKDAAADLKLAKFQCRVWVALYEFHRISFDEAATVVSQGVNLLTERSDVVPSEARARVSLFLGELYLLHGDLALAAPIVTRTNALIQSSVQSPTLSFNAESMYGLVLKSLGQNQAAEASMRDTMDRRIIRGERLLPYAAFDWFDFAENLCMDGRPREALDMLASAPEFGVMSGSTPLLNYAGVVPAARARTLLELNDAAGALALLPLFAPENATTVGTDASLMKGIRGEVLCASGRLDEGVLELLQSIHDLEPWKSSLDVNLLRSRAIAGICALQAGNRRLATELAETSRSAFDRQSIQISNWYVKPLVQLELRLRQPSSRH